MERHGELGNGQPRQNKKPSVLEWRGAYVKVEGKSTNDIIILAPNWQKVNWNKTLLEGK